MSAEEPSDGLPDMANPNFLGGSTGDLIKDGIIFAIVGVVVKKATDFLEDVGEEL